MVNQRNYFFPSLQSYQAVELVKDDPLAAREHIQLATFNSKTFVHVVQFFHKLLKTEDIILIQNHWLFKYQLNLLNEINLNLMASGKSVDFYDPIPPIQITRGINCCHLIE